MLTYYLWRTIFYDEFFDVFILFSIFLGTILSSITLVADIFLSPFEIITFIIFIIWKIIKRKG